MSNVLKVYNSLTREKEIFQPVNPPYVGMYVCGPTVYSDPHLGHARAAITFDIIFRYLIYLQYKVRYVRNITDVGHLVDENAGEGEDRIQKKARLEALEPMEVVEKYTRTYHQLLKELNVLSPSIEPRASGHIPEQIEMTRDILKNGFAYESNGSVYFDVIGYSKKEKYGELSGRIVDELVSGSRELDGQHEKKNPLDFALWKRASPEHLMKWNSPWGSGFPGWHLECSAMSTKYLGKQFDIHGGGMDLLFPHHECEVAQSKAANQVTPAKYWLHNNMVTINGQKMARSLGNYITIQQLLNGKHELLQRAYSAMTIRFFILQAHYRSTLDFSNDSLIAAAKGYKKLINGLRILKKIDYTPSDHPKDKALNEEILKSIESSFAGLNDDFNTAVTIGHLFNLLKKINSFYLKTIDLSLIEEQVFFQLKESFTIIVEDILGLIEEKNKDTEGFIESLLLLYKEAKEAKQYDRVDTIRAFFKKEGLSIKDMKSGIDWAYEE